MSNAQQEWFLYWMPENKTAWKKIPDSEEDISRAIKWGATYLTCLALNGEPDANPDRRGDLSIDLDCEDNPGKAIDETKKIIGHLEDVYGIDPHQLRIYLSGRKGCHLIIPKEILGATPGTYLHLEYRKIACKIVADLGLKTVDLSMYAGGKGKMLRLPNVKRKNGHYKVPVMLSELMGLPTEELIALTKQPRYLQPDDHSEDPIESGLLNQLFMQCREEIQKEKLDRQEHKPVGKEELEKLVAIPACIAAILTCEHHTDKINYNKLALNLASYCLDSGLSLAESEDLVDPLVVGYHSNTYPTEDKRREHFRAMHDFVKGNPDYRFSCSYIKGLGLSGNLFECSQCIINPDRKPTRAEFEKLIDEADNHDKILKDIHPQIIQADLLPTEVEMLQKKIKHKTKCSLNALREDAKGYEKSESELQLDFARAVIFGLGEENIITSSTGMRVWRGKGFWEESDPLLIKQLCHQVMPDKDIVKSKVDSVFDLIKTESYRPGHLWNQDMSTINCINGELQFNGGKWELKTHRRENYRTTQINVGYDPAAQAPKTQKFLEWVVAKDGKEGSEKKKLLLQIAGYCLLSTAIYEKIFILYGKGANGKSVYVDLIRHILGDNNHSAVSPCQLGDQFLRAHLHNKLANMVTELKHNEKLADEYIKKIASGETTTAAHKFGHPFDFKPFSTLLFATNHLPKSDDTTEAMRRRVVFVEFTNEISDEDQLAGFSRELAKEASGILNMVLDALSDVLKTGKFTIPRSCLQLSHRWIMQANHVAEFVDEVCQRVDDNDFVAAYYLYAHYRDWASANGVRIQHTKNAFGSSLRALGIQAKKDPTGNFRGYQIRLKYSNILLCPKNIDDSSGLPISSPDTV